MGWLGVDRRVSVVVRFGDVEDVWLSLNRFFGELVKSDMVVKLAGDKFRITTFGVVQMQKDVIPKIRAKIGI